MHVTVMLTGAVALAASLVATGALEAQSGEVALVPIPAVGSVAAGDISPFPVAKELARFNIARALLDEREKLKLSPVQRTALTALQSTLTARNMDVVARYDSVFRANKSVLPTGFLPATPTLKAADRTAEYNPRLLPSPRAGEPPLITEAMCLLWGASQELMVRHRKDVADAVALLEPGQLDEGMALLDKQSREMLKKLPQPPTRK